MVNRQKHSMASIALQKRERSAGRVQYAIFFRHDAVFEKFGTIAAFAEACHHYLSNYTSDYIYQNQSFRLVPGETKELGFHLYGSVKYGENIEDEWFVTFLLYKLSLWEKIQCWIRVVDDDGQFLLIESALHLPLWAEPELCANRVFVYRGRLLLIPPDILPGSPTLPQCLDVVMDPHVDETIQNRLTSGAEINHAISGRIDRFPRRIFEQRHKTRMYVPKVAAILLQNHPEILPHAVNAFYFRDAEELKSFEDEPLFYPTGENDLIPIVVTLTQCLYAQLVLQSQSPVRSFGCYFSTQLCSATSTEQRRWRSNGMKICCGCSILGKSNLDGSDIIKRFLERQRMGFQSDKDYDVSNETSEFSFGFQDEEDSDQWMAVDPHEFEKELKERYRDPNLVPGQPNGEDSLGDAALFKQTIDRFFDGTSEIDGIMPPEDDGECATAVPKHNEDIQLDPSKFFDILHSIAGAPVQKDSGEECPNVDDGLEIKDFIEAMDAELHQSSTASQTFQRTNSVVKTSNGQEKAHTKPEAERAEYNLNSVDLDFNLVSNLIESFQHQNGNAGPVSNIFSDLGLSVPQFNDGKLPEDHQN